MQQILSKYYSIWSVFAPFERSAPPDCGEIARMRGWARAVRRRSTRERSCKQRRLEDTCKSRGEGSAARSGPYHRHQGTCGRRPGARTCTTKRESGEVMKRRSDKATKRRRDKPQPVCRRGAIQVGARKRRAAHERPPARTCLRESPCGGAHVRALAIRDVCTGCGRRETPRAHGSRTGAPSLAQKIAKSSQLKSNFLASQGSICNNCWSIKNSKYSRAGSTKYSSICLSICTGQILEQILASVRRQWPDGPDRAG